MVRSMLLRNSQVRAFDKFFDDAWSTGFRNPFAVMDSVLESTAKPIPPEPGTKKVYVYPENPDSAGLLETYREAWGVL